MDKLTGFLVACLLLTASLKSVGQSPNPDLSQYRLWIEEMKTSERGPFSRIRWFCNDGTVLPVNPDRCEKHGGGSQHGEWNDRTVELREQGFYVATLLAGTNLGEFLAAPDSDAVLSQKLIEQFLLSVDNGWILRRALFYRGAIQEEGERRAARALLMHMASQPEWIGRRYAELMVAVRMLPHGRDSASVQNVRQVSASLAESDDGFKPLRAKIHGAPGSEDADRVRSYASGYLPEAEREPYLELANEIDQIYRAAPLEQELDLLADRYTAAPWLQDLLRETSAALRTDASAENRFYVSAALLAELRSVLPRIQSPDVRVQILDLALRVESENFRAASELRTNLAGTTRLQRLEYLRATAQAAYGTGLLNARLLQELDLSIDALGSGEVLLDAYLEELAYLGRVPGWGAQSLRRGFFDSMQKLAQIEPLAMLFIQDQLRGSPLLFYSHVLDGLSRDANRLAGVQHRLFSENIGVGFTALNSGLASGILHVHPDLEAPEKFSPDGIYVLPETISELPPVSGILTEGEGNPLSHVQLLARNLGIPNVTVDSSLIPALEQHDGERVVLAVSRSGLVELASWGQEWSDILASASAQPVVEITPDLEKLDLTELNFLPLDQLRAADSGRTVGPKAAKLGELHARYPGKVSRGLAIPFGLFKQEALDQPYPGGGTVFEWMVASYQNLAEIPANDPRRAEQTEAFRAEVYDIISNTRPSDAFVQQLRTAMEQTFAPELPPGVFIRSDTNVEDLPGFTGAGLNLTLPNVVGFNELIAGIPKVWASPFTARAFAWRQSLMTQPEHVYTSILLLESVPSDKSGVLVTQDIDTGNPGVISVAVNEGLGGAVDGQAAESLRIALDGSFVRVLATATAAQRRVPNPSGGLYFLPGSGSDTVLQPGEIQQLIEFSIGLPETFPSLADDEGRPAPADVEFGFVDGELRLFQIRPFLDSKSARAIVYLQEMEEQLNNAGELLVDLNGVPQ